MEKNLEGTKKIMVVVDMQKDFLDEGGRLTLFSETNNTTEFKQRVAERIKQHVGPVIVTYDTHNEDDIEFSRLPVHCVAGTSGHDLVDEVADALKEQPEVHGVGKGSFTGGKIYFMALQLLKDADEVEVVGVCTDICVASVSETLVTVAKESFNQLPKFVIQRDCVGDLDKEMADAALNRLTCLYGFEITE